MDTSIVMRATAGMASEIGLTWATGSVSLTVVGKEMAYVAVIRIADKLPVSGYFTLCGADRIK